MVKIRGHLDLFSGIGGFSLGLQQAGVEPDWIGFSDIDKYANILFKRRFLNAKELGTVTDVSYKSLGGQRIDLLTGGFPCQTFSIAGKRKGFDDTRGTLFFDIKRILEDYIRNGKPIPCILLENVKGLLNHDNGRTFATNYGILSNLDYTLECQLVNTKWWLPQNRERIYIFGRYNGNPGGRKIFPIYGKGSRTKQVFIDESMYRMEKKLRKYNGYSPTLNTSQGGGHIPLIREEDVNLIAKKRTHDTPKEINAYLKKHKDRTLFEIAKELDLPKTQIEHYFREDKSRAIPSPCVWLQLKELLGFDDTYDKQVTEIHEKEYEFESSKRVYSDKGISQTLDTSNTGLYKVKSAALRTYPRNSGMTKEEKKKRGKRLEIRDDNVANTITSHQLDSIIKENVAFKTYGIIPESDKPKGNWLPRERVLESNNGLSRAISTSQSQHPYYTDKTRIRRLIPLECERLQGFPDNWTDGQSDTQRYKQCGNAVSVPVTEAIFRKIYISVNKEKEK